MAELCSIIIPTYNHGKFIERSIECALNQTYPNVEVIVVDDGSTDDTPKRIARFGDRIRYIWKENSGRGDNRNVGIKQSSGKYIQFLDADDTISSEKLRIQASILESDETLALVYSDCTCTDPSGEHIENASYPLGIDEDPLSILVFRSLFGIHAALTRREAIISVGMFDMHPYAQEDWDLWFRIALEGYGFKYVPGELAHYDQQGSTTIVNPELMYLRMRHMLEKHRDSSRLNQSGEHLIRSFVAQQNLQLATRAYNNGWWKEACGHFIEVARNDRRLMTSKYWACIPKAVVHRCSDLLLGKSRPAPTI
jgi:glycosyltransferase involved in cell wall biosynthesis